jgi:hypothetical protein
MEITNEFNLMHGHGMESSPKQGTIRRDYHFGRKLFSD